MAAAIPSQIPAQIRAGATLSFKSSLADYQAGDGWSVTYSFRNTDGSLIDFTSAADGGDHLFTVPFSTTANWIAGTYFGVAVVSDGTTKAEVWSGSLTVLPNIASAEQGQDFRSQARRTLDNINTVLEGRATSTILNSSVEGTNLGRIPHADLLLLRDRYVSIVKAEERAADAANGKPSRRAIFTQFLNPR